MTVANYTIRLCQSCGLRYSLVENHPFGERCPSCLGTTILVAAHRIASQPASLAIEPKMQLEALLDNIRSAWNVGSIFRTADGLGVEKLYLCGITPTPENGSVTKTSLGAEQTVEWEYSRNALETANQLKTKEHMLIALEQDERAISIHDFLSERNDRKGVKSKREKIISQTNPSTTDFANAASSAQGGETVLILGNEITGVDPAILDICDHIVYIPMRGRKRSFNVEVAFAIAACSLANL